MNIANQLVLLLQQNSKKIATAESCTGGLLGGAITSVSGSSSVFDVGIVSYANHIKSKLLDVDTSTLEQFGAVSEQVALQMANGVLNLSSADLAISITGIAGPDGGTPIKPVGTVYVGIATKTDCYAVNLALAPNLTREQIRSQTVTLSLELAFEKAKEIF